MVFSEEEEKNQPIQKDRTQSSGKDYCGGLCAAQGCVSALRRLVAQPRRVNPIWLQVRWGGSCHSVGCLHRYILIHVLPHV